VDWRYSQKIAHGELVRKIFLKKITAPEQRDKTDLKGLRTNDSEAARMLGNGVRPSAGAASHEVSPVSIIRMRLAVAALLRPGTVALQGCDSAVLRAALYRRFVLPNQAGSVC